jgi:predicted ATP-grasp superfamily ATP-dependent carboligase
MRILVHEFVTGGGLAGRDVPSSLAREGAAMRTALVADLAATRRHEIVATADPRFPLRAPRSVHVETLSDDGGEARLDSLIDRVDAVWFVAPESNGCLERLAATAERKGRILLGSGAETIRKASDKARLSRLLTRHGVAHPATRCVHDASEWETAAGEIGYPIVIKPARGAGCEGVQLVRTPGQMLSVAGSIRRDAARGPVLLQRYLPGTAASVSLLADGKRAVALTLNAQSVRFGYGRRRDGRVPWGPPSGGRALSLPFRYGGGRTPLDHPLAARAVAAALRTCEALPGLRGYVGIDLVLTQSEAVVIEVNPRLTTAYLGVRSALDGNVAEMALAACAGLLPLSPPARRCVRFTAGGRILSVVSLRAPSHAS